MRGSESEMTSYVMAKPLYDWTGNRRRLHLSLLWKKEEEKSKLAEQNFLNSLVYVRLSIGSEDNLILWEAEWGFDLSIALGRTRKILLIYDSYDSCYQIDLTFPNIASRFVYYY